MQDTKLKHRSTGPICTDHFLATTGTATLSIVSRRLLYLREVKRGLGHHGLSSVLHNNSDLWKRLFLINQDKVNANCVLPLLHPQLSEKETSRWQAEENILVFLNDFLFHAEDSAVTGYDGQLIVMKTERNWRGWREFARGTFWSS